MFLSEKKRVFAGELCHNRVRGPFEGIAVQFMEQKKTLVKRHAA